MNPLLHAPRVALKCCLSQWSGNLSEIAFSCTCIFTRYFLNFHTKSLWVSRVLKYPKKCLGGLDNIFHVYLMRKFQKYERNWILTVGFWGQTKTGQKCAARWAELAVSHRENKISFTFLESTHQVDTKNIAKSSEHFLGYFNTL